MTRAVQRNGRGLLREDHEHFSFSVNVCKALQESTVSNGKLAA
jgi:hypothetical protein